MIPVKNFHILKSKHSRIHEVNFDNLEFGKHVSDHMLVADFSDQSWREPHIVPFANLSLSPASLCFHYGQTVFEGIKAFRMNDGRVNIFRLDRHYQRFLKTLDRMCMPAIPEEIFIDGITSLVELDKAWIPVKEGDSLYVRPMMIATDTRFGVKVSDQYRFIVFTGPVPALYTKPISVKVETDFSRAAKGGTGYAKCGGNYGGAFYPTMMARKQGFDQLLWTDAASNTMIEESGMMNVMFVIDDVLVTPPLSDTILDGITRESLLILATEMSIETCERKLSIEELKVAASNKLLTEAFGAGTAAVVAPIQRIRIAGEDLHLPEYSSKSICMKLQGLMSRIRRGEENDKWGWNFIV